MKPPHAYILLERKAYRLDRTLSDIKGRDPYVYGKSVRTLIASVLDALRRSSGTNPSTQEVFSVYRALIVIVGDLKREQGVNTLYRRSLFQDTVASAAVLAAKSGLIEEF